MAEFPQSFTEPKHLAPWHLPAKHGSIIQNIEKRGIVVVAGMQPSDVAALTEISAQEGTLEFCTNDLARRWTDIDTARKQLAKDGGRAVIRFLDVDTMQTAGFGWVGSSSADEREQLPRCENTFALRIHKRFQKKGLGEPFSRAIVATAMALYGAEAIGLETWGSNTGAVRSYLSAGAELVTTKDDMRPTRIPEQQDENGMRRDVRMYMQFPWSKLLPPLAGQLKHPEAVTLGVGTVAVAS